MRPPGRWLVKDAVWVFHEPDKDLDQRIDVEIVFMHGPLVVGHADGYWKTWQTRDGSEIWPAIWLRDKYPNARILSLSYNFEDSDPRLWGPSCLHCMVEAEIGQNGCPVIFVCHGLGAFVAQVIAVCGGLSNSDEKIQKLRHSIMAFVFYATSWDPKDIFEFWLIDVLVSTGFHLPILQMFKYEYYKCNKQWRFYIVAEGHKTPYNLPEMFLPQEWAPFEWGASSEVVTLPEADHLTVSKPESREDKGYTLLMKCIDKVVKAHRRKRIVALDVKPIGIGDKLELIHTELNSANIPIIGLFGAGGVGKTTLSKYYFSLKERYYVKSCYLENVKSRDIQDVQRELLEKLFGEKFGQNEGVQQYHLDKIKQCFQNMKVLVVIDDVTSAEDCKNYLEGLQVFEALDTESAFKVIVTGRAEGILPIKYVKSGKAITVPIVGILDGEGSDRKLFELYAFDGVVEEEKPIFQHVANEIVDCCEGLPLCLEVIGKYLGDKNREPLHKRMDTWEEACKRLSSAKRINGEAIDVLWSCLKLSYEDLTEDEQVMFLDFACIFSEHWDATRSMVESIWDSEIGIKNLMKKSLLKVSSDEERFSMHDCVRDMGRMIVQNAAKNDPSRQSYLWEENDVKRFLRDNKVSTTLRGLSLKLPIIPQPCLHLCPHLKLLWLANGLGIEALFPDFFDYTPCLEGLVLVAHGLKELPTSLWKLQRLRCLEIVGWEGVLPESIKQLSQLQRLILKHCTITRHPESFGNVITQFHGVTFIDCDDTLSRSSYEEEQASSEISTSYEQEIRCLDLEGTGLDIPENESDDVEIPLQRMREEIMKIDNIFEVSLEDLDGEETIVLCCFDPEDNLFQFYFKHRSDMARVVGVGLEYAKAVLVEGWKVEIEEICEVDWVLAWKQVGSGSTTMCKLLKLESCPLHQPKKEVVLLELPKRPHLWDLAKYFTLKASIDALAAKDTDVKYATANGASSSKSRSSNESTTEDSGGNEEDKAALFQAFTKWFARNNRKDNDDEENYHNGKGPADPSPSGSFDRDANTKVVVHLLPGGEILGKTDFDEKLRTLDRTIVPTLEFTFVNRDGSKRVQVIVGNIRFNLVENDFDENGETEQAYWIHERMKVSFGLLDTAKDYGEILRDSIKHFEVKSGTENIKASVAIEEKKGKEISVRGGISGKVYGVGMVGHVERKDTSSVGDTRLFESSLETSCDLSAGGLMYKGISDPDEREIAFKYYFPHSKDSYPALFKSPMRFDQAVKFQGTWTPLDLEGFSPNFATYSLRVSRVLEEIIVTENTKKKTHIKCVQTYKKTLLINHAMTHLDGKGCQLRERLKIGELPYFSEEGSTRPYKWKNGVLVELETNRVQTDSRTSYLLA